jgi:tetratricopeptide (TPR) repeat protein
MTLSLFLGSSCDKFLDVKPTDSAAAGTAINTADDAGVIINGVMSAMASSSYYGKDFILYGDVKGGDVTIVSQGRGDDALYSFNHSATSNAYSGFWSQIYYCLLQLNNLLDNIERIETEGNGSDELNEYKGQALTLRALMYFDLVRLYGKPYTQDNGASLGVPMPLTVLDAYAKETRKTVAENYTQILKDLTDADGLLPKDITKGYINYYANKAIQARVYLFMGNYSAALAAAEEIITDNKYTLYDNNSWLASWSSEFGSEAIFELGIYQNEADLGRESLGYYFMRRAKISNAMGHFVASTGYIQSLAGDPDDVRHGIMDFDETSSTRFGSCNKYTGNDNKGDKGSPSAVNIKIIRLSEIHLIAAEAALSSTPQDKAKAAFYLNNIRKRAPNLTPVTENTVTLDLILEEKSKEFFGEGLRFFDMMRLNKTITFDDSLLGSAVITHRGATVDRTFYKAILPIPQSELDANPAIIPQQNPGYN